MVMMMMMTTTTTMMMMMCVWGRGGEWMAETDMYVPLRLVVQILQKILQRKQQKLIVLVVSIMLRGHDFVCSRTVSLWDT